MVIIVRRVSVRLMKPEQRETYNIQSSMFQASQTTKFKFKINKLSILHDLHYLLTSV